MLKAFSIKILFIVTFALTGTGVALAHNKVVVIPMAGDDVPEELTPTTPIARDDVSLSDYTINSGLLTVFDKTTQLDWQREDDGQFRSWEEAVEYCFTLDLSGHTDWRLPTVNELLSIVDYGQTTTPLIDPIAFLNTSTGGYSTSLRSSTMATQYWIVRFNDGESFTTTLNSHVRCVRTRPLN